MNIMVVLELLAKQSRSDIEGHALMHAFDDLCLVLCEETFLQ